MNIKDLTLLRIVDKKTELLEKLGRGRYGV